ncbi:MAG: fasciclin domain-containing protein [Bacteroidales bacterium]|nr:fasciclin domain-containing protein [Bacteroidales bacterium]
MIRNRQIVLFTGILVLFASCNDFYENEKFQRPDWLAGKLYTQIKEQSDLSTFARCIELTGYDTIINASGSYTVFAPDNEAFALYFQSNPDYQSVEEIPMEELARIVKYHIVQNPWSREQLKSLDVYGWIDTLDINNDEPRGYKRETLLRDKDQKYGVKYDENKIFCIVDTSETNWHRRQTTDSRKYAPIFYQEYLDIYDLGSDDFEFYFNRPFENSNDIYYLGGRLRQEDIFAENGFIYIIDRLIEPLKNAFQILSTEAGNYSYSDFLDLINKFPQFTYNQDKTFDQPGAELGYEVDSLFDITYPALAFDICNEKTQPPSGTFGLPSNVTIRYHHGLIAPTNEALDEFASEYLAGGYQWSGLEGAPYHIKRMIVNTYMSTNAIYPTDFKQGFYNGELDIVRLDEETIVQKQYGSNCTFIGVNKAIVPRAFKSVSGPIYLTKGYSIAMFAIEHAELLSALKKEDKNYLLFIESDANCRDDSSLLNSYDSRTGDMQFSAFSGKGASTKEKKLTTNDIRILLLNHIGTAIPKGLANKEFIPNLAGNFLIVNNQTGEVSGTAQTMIGYNGEIPVTVFPTQISTNADNGITYEISNWFSFSAATLYVRLSSSFIDFHSLLINAGLGNQQEERYTFLSENENYTVFIPNDSVLSTLPDSLKKDPNFLRMHFVQGDMIFTDGNKVPGYYETTRIDEKSTTYTTIYTKVYIEPGIDLINIPDKTGGVYLTIPESDITNQIAGRNLGDGTEAFANILSNAVIHVIDKVLLFEELDTE